MENDEAPSAAHAPKPDTALFSSRQRSLVSTDQSSMFTPCNAQVTQVSVAQVQQMKDLYPSHFTKTYPNVFARTKITLADDATGGSQSAAPGSGAKKDAKEGGDKGRSALSTAKAISALTASTSPATAAGESAPAAPSTVQLLEESEQAHARVQYSQFIGEDEFVLLDIVRRAGPCAATAAKGFIRAGPRERIVYDAAEVRAAIVTCGSMCPGHNDAVEELFNCLYYNYGVDTVYGIKGGFRGFWDQSEQPWEPLSPSSVRGISGRGGSILGTSKGGFDAQRILNSLEVYGVNQLYIIGGDGTHRAAAMLHAAARARGLRLAVGCLPNSLDNDVGVIDNSFGFATAVQMAARAIESVQVESMCAPNGIGIVQLMGKHAGYIASHAVLAARDADLCLIPELPFRLHGPGGVLEYLRRVVQRQGYAIIVVAEGAGAPLLEAAGAPEGVQIGQLLRENIAKYFKRMHMESTIRFVDPSYMIRSIPASAADSIHCLSIAHNAVHGAMAGFTAFSSAIVNYRSVLLPIDLVVASSPSSLNPRGRTWERVLSLTQQPSWPEYETADELRRAQNGLQAKLG